MLYYTLGEQGLQIGIKGLVILQQICIYKSNLQNHLQTEHHLA